MSQCEYLFDKLDEIEQKVKASEKVFLGMDHDGTVSEIITTLADARMTYSMRETIKNLRDNPNIYVAMISGRILRELKDVAKIEDIYYAGNHGFEIEGPYYKNVFNDKEALENIANITEKETRKFENVEGVWFEKKIFTTSFHYRGVPPEKQESVRQEIFDALSQYDNVRIVEGKMLFNIRPIADINKGQAFITIAKHLYKDDWRKHLTGIYIGDDNSDEDALKILEDKDIGIVVNPNPPEHTNAGYYVNKVKEIEDFLKWLNEV